MGQKPSRGQAERHRTRSRAMFPGISRAKSRIGPGCLATVSGNPGFFQGPGSAFRERPYLSQGQEGRRSRVTFAPTAVSRHGSTEHGGRPILARRLSRAIPPAPRKRPPRTPTEGGTLGLVLGRRAWRDGVRRRRGCGFRNRHRSEAALAARGRRGPAATHQAAAPPWRAPKRHGIN
jgi:hypothetical protein